MYHEFGSNTGRHGWTYEYKGEEIMNNAALRLVAYATEEKVLRESMAVLMRDPSVAASSKQVEDLRRDIERVSKLHEECQVYAHEFARNPVKTYRLGLGDVVFFGLFQKSAG